MNLILKEYLNSLKERNELDALLPNLLSQMGLNVFSTPSTGTAQKGVDVAAVGKIDRSPESVYLISIKSSDLTRADWDNNPQALRPSLNQIIDSYIPNRLPKEYKDLPIVICICTGGIIRQEVQEDVSSFIDRNSDNGLSFQEWNGDYLTKKISKFFINEKLMPLPLQRLLRKSIALADEPETSFTYFKELINKLSKNSTLELRKKIRPIRQIYLCLSILLGWCRGTENLEAAYLSSEYTLLIAWDYCKAHSSKNTKNANYMAETLISIINLCISISDDFIDKIKPFCDKVYALSMGINPQSPVDVNFKLFDILSRISLNGIWYYWLKWYLNGCGVQTGIDIDNKIKENHSTIINLIKNNPMLYSPYTEDQAIDISITIWFLALYEKNISFIEFWLNEMTERCFYNFITHKKYPSYLNKYEQLLTHPVETTEIYRKNLTGGSVLYPMISIYSSIFGFSGVYNKTKKFSLEHLQHCAFQAWFPDEDSEKNYYTNIDEHGYTLTIDKIDISQEELLNQVFNECDETTYYNNLSASKKGWWPLIFLASKHYRHPLPIQYLKEVKDGYSKSKEEKDSK